MAEFNTLYSKLDDSVNFTHPLSTGGIYECRFVQREPEQISLYLSSQAGCKQACRMCHLTQSGQINDESASVEELILQTNVLFEYIDQLPHDKKIKIERVNFNFMARGEPLASPVILNEFKQVYDSLSEFAITRNLEFKFNISTIMPRQVAEIRLSDIFTGCPNTTIYYSLYSVEPSFRKKWLPKSIHHDLALHMLAQWYYDTNVLPVIHYAFIKDINDDEDSIIDIIHSIPFSLRNNVRFNVVRYNPYSADQGEESPDWVIQRNFEMILPHVHPSSQIVTRVGMDIYSSCGMFIQ
jgi:23S rRNA (adenine2503-C2)-methyltransferase